MEKSWIQPGTIFQVGRVVLNSVHKCWIFPPCCIRKCQDQLAKRYALTSSHFTSQKVNNYICLHYEQPLPLKIYIYKQLKYSIIPNLWVCAPAISLCGFGLTWQKSSRPQCIFAHWRRSDQPFVQCEKNVFHLVMWNPLFTHAPWT